MGIEHPVSEFVPASRAVQVITTGGTDAGTGFWVRSTKLPTTNCSGECAVPRVVSGIVVPLVPVGTLIGLVPPGTNASGSMPTDSTAGRSPSGCCVVGSKRWTIMPTPTESPAARGNVYRKVLPPIVRMFAWPCPSSVVSAEGQ